MPTLSAVSSHLFLSNPLSKKRAFLFIALTALLSACGVPGPGGTGGGGVDFGDPEIGENDPEASVIRVPITVEATSRMMQEAVTPDTPNIITADNISCDRISVVQLNFDFQEVRGSSNVPDYTSKERNDFENPNTQGCQLEFVENFEPRLDAVIRVEYPNNDVLYAPLRRAESNDQSIVVSFGSHLVLESLYSKFNDSFDLSRTLPCSGENPDCETQHRAKARLTSFMAETARLYEYENDVLPTDTATQALNTLRSKSDLMTHIDTAVSEITRSESPIAKGTVRSSYDPNSNSDILNGVLQSRLQPSERYNSVFFAMGFEDDSQNNFNKLMTASSHIASEGASVLPQLIHNAYYLDYRYDDVLPNIPIEMTTFQFRAGSRSSVIDPTLPENRYAFITSDQSNGSLVNGTHLSNQGFFLNDRAIAQQITDTPDGESPAGLVGYDFNPVYYKLYRVNDYEPDTSLDNLNEPTEPDYGTAPTWLTGAGYGLTNTYNVTQTSSNPDRFERQDIRAAQPYFSWETHGLQTTANINESDISGKNYDVIEFSISLNEITVEELVVRAETLVWNASSSSFGEQQPGAQPHYRTRELARRNDNSFEGARNTDYIRSDLATPSTRYSLYETDLTDEDGNAFQGPNGLINFVKLEKSRGLGHVSENAEHMAFAIDRSNNTDAKRGIILASQQRSLPIRIPANETLDFTLSGNYFFMDSNTHRLASVNESQLSVSRSSNQDCDASLSIEGVSIEHTITGTPSNQIQDATPLTQVSVNSTACALNGGQVEIDFPPVNGQALKLRGFAVRDDGDSGRAVKLINLLWLQDNALGLVFAQKDQDLSATFDE